MKEDIAKRWIEALRSGKYEQGKNQLRSGNSFCCLGVLCDLNDPAGWDGEAYGEDVLFATVPLSVRRWSGLDDDTGVIRNKGETNSLSKLNDDGASFSEIADIIEREWPNL